MKYVKYFFLISSLLLLSVALTSCVGDSKKKDQSGSVTQGVQTQESKAAQPMTLPVQYQTASYLVSQDKPEDLATSEENQIKVGARITSTQGPQPLWDIVKRLAALKGMNVSWASDVDRNVLVDVDINASDDFFEALDNMLRQVDYYHEVLNNTLVIKYRETRQFQIAMPFTKHKYSTGTGGNVLGDSEGSNNVDGTIMLKSTDNEFDIWDNIKLNLDTILQIWTPRREGETVARNTDTVEGSATEGSRKESAESAAGASTEIKSADASIDVTGGQGYYLIDKPVGIITVTAPRPLLEKIEAYITNLKQSLYKQISIEAKIIEVQLTDSSSIGINWSNILKNFNITGEIGFGSDKGNILPLISNSDKLNGIGSTDSRGTYFKEINPVQFISNISLEAAGFDVFLNALNEQGNTKILSNPKLSVMNGQPAMITVGRNVTYISKQTSSVSDAGNGTTSYETETARILSGVGMALTATVLGSDEIIMNLVPLTSELEEPIDYIDAPDGGTVGLPIVNVREMNTTVKIRSGEMLVIGGLISDTDSTSGEFAPLLGDIPILRYLFGYEEKEHIKRELIILLRPRII